MEEKYEYFFLESLKNLSAKFQNVFMDKIKDVKYKWPFF